MASFHTTAIPGSTLIRDTIPLFALPVEAAVRTLATLETVPALACRLFHAAVLLAQIALAFVVARAFAALGFTGTGEAFQNGLVVPRDDALAFVATVGLAVGVGTAFAAFLLFAVFGSGSSFYGAQETKEEEEREESKGRRRGK